MQPVAANPAWTRMLAVGLVTLIISALFIGMVWDFLIALFLAAVFSAMASPLHRRVLSLTRRRRGIAAAATLLLLIVGVLLPGLVLLNVIVVQANELAADVMPWIKQQLSDLFNSVLTATLLVFIVIVWALGVRSATLVGLAIPSSFLAAILTLSLLGIPVSPIFF